MTTELYNNWIVNLTSGKYNAGNDMLKYRTFPNDLYCCLGVVCDISELGKWETTEDKETYYRTNTSTDSTIDDLLTIDPHLNNSDNSSISMHYLPPDVQHALNLRTNDGQFSFGELSDNLQSTIRSNFDYGLHFSINDAISLTKINDECASDLVFEVIAQILEERPPSLFRPEPAPQNANG